MGRASTTRGADDWSAPQVLPSIDKGKDVLPGAPGLDFETWDSTTPKMLLS